MSTVLRLVFEDAAAAAREYEANLRFARVHVAELVTAERGSAAALVLERRDLRAELTLLGRVAVVIDHGPMRGTALELDLDRDDAHARLARFVADALEATTSAPEQTLDDLPTLDFAPRRETSAHADDAPPDQEFEREDDEDDDTSRATIDPKITRIRKLSATDRTKLARDGQLEDRLMLERVFGKAVWDELLRNPGITVPEVARIAQKGTAPRHLLELIVDNAAWSRQSIVRRALLANPRVGSDAVTKLLRATPKNELKMMTQGTAYPLAVRSLAKRLLDE